MSVVINNTYKCPVCGKIFESENVTDISTDCDRGLDTNVHDDNQFKQIVICPDCGYSAPYYFEVEDDDIIEFVRSKEYSDVFNSEWDPVIKKWMLAGYISKYMGNHYDAGYEFMVAGWYARDYTKIPNDFQYAMHLAIAEFSAHVEETYEVNSALIVVDLLRQVARFQEAFDFALELRDSGLDDDTNKILDFELQKISESDTKEHLISEV